jgi:hypothetical protein
MKDQMNQNKSGNKMADQSGQKNQSPKDFDRSKQSPAGNSRTDTSKAGAGTDFQNQRDGQRDTSQKDSHGSTAKSDRR